MGNVVPNRDTRSLYDRRVKEEDKREETEVTLSLYLLGNPDLIGEKDGIQVNLGFRSSKFLLVSSLSDFLSLHLVV